MINALIIEDEFPAAARLEKLLSEISKEINILDKIDSVSSAVKWFQENKHPSLLFLDIQLADGLSFDIFKKVNIESFVIFTTAYDEFAIKAFELNSVDYLLKPIDKQKLTASIDKFKRFNSAKFSIPIETLLESIAGKSHNYKKRFAINIGARIKSIETDAVCYFTSLEKNTFLKTFDDHEYPIDFSLDRLETLLDPEKFFRINRQTIIQYNAIDKINILSKSRVQLNVAGASEPILVSTAKSHSFRIWLDK